MKLASERAFPMSASDYTPSQVGLTKRELFAAMAMQGYLTMYTGGLPNPDPGKLAANCCMYADALLRALEGK